MPPETASPSRIGGEVGDTSDLIQWSFSEVPQSRADAARMTLPFGGIITPLRQRENTEGIAECVASYHARTGMSIELDPLSGDPVLLRAPERCAVCSAILNPFCTIDVQSRTWTCSMCTARTDLPQLNPHTASNNSERGASTFDHHDLRIPFEMHPACTCVTYRLAPPAPSFLSVPSVFFFVVDLSVPTQEEFAAMKERLLQCVSALPSDVHVGLITYGAAVYLHELGSDATLEFRRCHSFRGATECTTAIARGMLHPEVNGNRFTLPMADADFVLHQIIEELDVDKWAVPKGTRPRRCTGAAISLAAAVLELFHTHTPARIVSLVSGISCDGPGKAADLGKEHLIRGHADIRDRTPPASEYLNSCAFYERLMKQLIRNAHCLDVFAVCLDQTGVAEMRTCVQLTGGTLVLCDTWTRPHLRRTMERFFQRAPEHVGAMGDPLAPLEHMNFDVTFEVQSSASWRVCGVIGPCTGSVATSQTAQALLHESTATTTSTLDTASSQSVARAASSSTHAGGAAASSSAATAAPLLNRFTTAITSTTRTHPMPYSPARLRCISDTEVGMGGTAHWVTSVMEDDVAVSVFFDVAPLSTEQTAAMERALASTAHYRFVQFVTTYLHISGERRMRVVTVPHRIQKVTNYPILIKGFHQEVAAVLLAKLCTFKSDTAPLVDLLRWLDRHLIRFVARFGDYRKDDASSLRLDRAMSLFPVFMYHLRRSPILSYFNASPDETALVRYALARMDATSAMLMIHPTLHAYTMSPVDGTEASSAALVRPVSLEPASIHPEAVLVLDTFFDVLVYHGETIAAWMSQGYHEQEDYAHFRAFLRVPQEAANKLAETRQPSPIVLSCKHGSPAARILLNKINPARGGSGTVTAPASAAGSTSNGSGDENVLMWSEDVTLQTFIEHLKKAAVQTV